MKKPSQATAVSPGTALEALCERWHRQRSSWADVLVDLERLPALTATDRLLLGLVRLETGLEGATLAEHLIQTRGDESLRPLAEWVGAQIDAELEAGVDADAVARDYRYRLATLRAGQALQALPELPDSPSLPTLESNLLEQLRLAALGQWGDLAEVLQRGDAVERCIAAHLFGDRLGQRSQQKSLLEGVSELWPTYVGDVLLDLAFAAEGGTGEVLLALDRRHEALTRGGATEDLAVSALFFGLFGDVEPAVDVAEVDAHRALVQLDTLGRRRRAAKNRRELAELYLSIAKQSSPPDRTAARLRAAHLLMAVDAQPEALACLEEDPAGGTFDTLLLRTRVLFAARSGVRTVLADALVALAAAADRSEARAALQLALALSWPDAPALATLAGRIEGILATAAWPLVWEAGGLLLAVARRVQAIDPQLRRRIWQLLLSRATEPQDRAVCASGLILAGGCAVSATGGEKTTADLRLATEPWSDSPVLLAALALACDDPADWRRLAWTIADGGRHCTDAKVAASLMRDAAQAVCMRSDDREEAVVLMNEACQRCPGDITLLEDLAALHLHRGQPDQAVSALEQAAAACDGEHAADLYCAVGEVCAGGDALPDAASAAYTRALELMPRHRAALYGLYRLIPHGRYTQRLPILRALLEVAEDVRERTTLQLDLAQELAAQWRDGGGPVVWTDAVDHALGVLSSSTHAEDAAALVVRLSAEAERHDVLLQHSARLRTTLAGLRGVIGAIQADEQWKEALVCWQELALRTPSSAEKVDALVEGGIIASSRLADIAQARELLEQACIIDPTHLKARDALRHVFVAAESWESLAELLLRALPHLPVDQRPALHHELAALYRDHLGRADLARQQLEAVLELVKDDLPTLEQLEALLAAGGAHRERARLLERIVARLGADPASLPHLVNLGTVYQQLGDDKAVTRIVQTLQKQHGDSAEAFAFCEKVYQSQQRYLDLSRLYERRLSHVELQPDAAKDAVAQLLERKGKLELERLGARTAAAESFMRLLDIRPGDTPTLQLLEQMLSTAGDWTRLADLYQRQANAVKDQQSQISFLRLAANVARDKLGDEADYMRLYERIHKLDPTDEEAFSALERRLERQEDYKRLVDLLTEHARCVADVTVRLDATLRAAAICERIPDVERALELYRAAVELSAANSTALDALARIYESTERWGELLAVTEKQVAIETNTRRRAVLYFKCGSVMETQFHDDDRALRYYMAAIKSSASCLPALHGLRDIYSRRQEWEKVANALELEVRLWKDAEGKADTLARVGEVYANRLHDRDKALSYWTRALQQHPECLPAAFGLFEMHVAAKNWAEAAKWGGVCARGERLKALPAQEKHFHLRWGTALLGAGQPKAAADAVWTAVRKAPEDVETLGVFLMLCREHAEVWDFAAALDELGRTRAAQESPVTSAYLAAAYGVLAEQRGDLENALELYQKAYDSSAVQMQVLAGYCDLLVAVDREAEALSIAQDCKLQASDPAEWCAAVEWIARHELLRRSCPDRAAVLYAELLQRDPQNAAVREQLVRALILAGNDRQAQIEARKLCETEGLAIHFHLMGVAAYRGGRLDEAERCWRRAIETSPAHIESSLALARKLWLAGEAKGAERELKVAEQNAEESGSEVLRAEAQFYRATGYPERAVVLQQKACRSRDPLIDDRIALAQLMASRGEHANAVETLDAVIAEREGYAPAYDALAQLRLAMGDTRGALRATQVYQAVTGVEHQRGTPPPLLRPISDDGWAALTERVHDSSWGRLLLRVADVVPSWQETDPTVERSEVQPELAATLDQLGRVWATDADLVFHERQDVPLRVRKSTLMLGRRHVDGVSAHDQRPILCQGMAIIRLGHQAIFGAPRTWLRQLNELVEAVVARGFAPSPAVQEVVRRLPRKDQRLVTQLRSEDDGPASVLLENWMAEVSDLWGKMGLLATEDFVSSARMLMLSELFPAEVTANGGLLTASAAVGRLARYYLSPQYAADRLQLFA